jgi:hypothetical protein
MEQNEFINKAHNLKMKEKQSRAKKQRRRMQNLFEHVKLLHACVSLGNIIAKQRNLIIWSNSTITLHDIDALSVS